MEAADLPRRHLADKYLHAAIVPANAYQRTKFQLSSTISFEDWGGPTTKSEKLLISTDAP